MKSEKLIPLTKEQVTALKTTFRSLDTEKLAERFYARLFEKHPEVKPMFPPDLTELKVKIISVFELVIYSFEERAPGKYYLQQPILLPLRTLGKKHSEKGVSNFHYPIANEVLIESVEAEAGYVLPEVAKSAWKLALEHLTHAMLTTDTTQSANYFATIRDSYQYIRKQLLKL